MEQSRIVKIEELQLWDKNPRSISEKDFERLKRQIKKLGQYKPLIVNQDNIVLGGNMRLRALQDLGVNDVWVNQVKTKDEAEMIEYALSDNDRAGEYDEEQLAELATLHPIDLQLYKVDLGSATSLSEVVDEYGPGASEDEPPEVDESNVVSKLGEVYQLGKHKVMCGDSTDNIQVEELMSGVKANMCFTDPPYNVDYTGSMNTHSKNEREGIMNDKMSKQEFYKFLSKVCVNILQNTEGGIYICMSSSELDSLKSAFEKAGGHWQSFIIWVKNTFTLSRSDYQNTYEPILYGWKSTNKNHFFINMRNNSNVWEELNQLKTKFDGEYTIIKFQGYEVKIKGKVEGEVKRRKQKVDIWRYDKPNRSDEHPTMKPIVLCAYAINNSCVLGGIVLDLFLGSGSTLIACEQTGRICYGMELDPKYVDVIRKRYAKFIGKEEEWEQVTPLADPQS